MPSEPQHPVVLAWINDLIFETRIRTALSESGLEFKLVKTAREVEAAISKPKVVMLIADLNTIGGDGVKTLGYIRSEFQGTIVAFASHIDTELIRSAERAGADQVYTRSQFVRELPEIQDKIVHDTQK